MARHMQVVALLNRQQMSPHAKAEDPLKFGYAYGDIPIVWASLISRSKEREKFKSSIQPALAYEDMSEFESSAKPRMAVRQ